MTLRGRVLITGGTGSLGTHLLATAERERWDAEFVVFSRDEVKQAALRERFPAVRFVLGYIQDREGLERAMRGAETVIHTAAYKRVPEAERQTVACITANVDGSMNVALAALAAGVKRVVALSTDKACTPINAYGQSKALMERLWQSLARQHTPTRFHLVRYGNVLASRGSVIPVLQAQVAAGNPITITDPDMTRFWLTLDDAVSLVLESMRLEPGEVLIPACRSSTMGALADAIAPDYPIEVIGTRGGERMHEKLVAEEEAPYIRHFGAGWALRSLSLPVRDVMPPGWVYSSLLAERFSAAELHDVMEKVMAEEEVRTL